MNEEFINLRNSESITIPVIDFSNCIKKNCFRQTFEQAGITPEIENKLLSSVISVIVKGRRVSSIPISFKNQSTGPDMQFFTETDVHNVFTLNDVWVIDFNLKMISVRPALYKEETGKIIISPEIAKGRELHFSQWIDGNVYYNNALRIDLVGYKSALLACLKDHVANTPPKLMYYNDRPIGVDSPEWAFIFGFPESLIVKGENEPEDPIITPLEIGDIHYNTIINSPIVWTGSEWKFVHSSKILIPFNLNPEEISNNTVFGEENTIYDIVNHYDLGGHTIKLAHGVGLNFIGGSIKNGVIEGDGSATIMGNPTYNIFDNTVIKGFQLEYLDLRWFGAIEGEDCYQAFTNCMKTFEYNLGTPIKVIGHYKLAKRVYCHQGLIIDNIGSGYNPFRVHRDATGQPYYYGPHVRPDATRDKEEMNFIGEIDVCIPYDNTKDISHLTAFYINTIESSDSIGKNKWAYEAPLYIRGVSFKCSEVLNKFMNNDKTTPTTDDKKGLAATLHTLVEYNCGGMPATGFRIEECSVRGFRYGFKFNGGAVHYGSIGACVLFDNVNFRYNYFSIYTHMRRQKSSGIEIHNISLTNLEITRCSFEHGSKLHLEGLYGTNIIHNCIIQNTKAKIVKGKPDKSGDYPEEYFWRGGNNEIPKDPYALECEYPEQSMDKLMYVSLRNSSLRIDHIYMEEINGDFAFVNQHPDTYYCNNSEYYDCGSSKSYTFRDTLSQIDFGEFYVHTGDSHDYNFIFREVNIVNLPASIQENNIKTYNCSINDNAIIKSNKGNLTMESVCMDDFSHTHKENEVDVVTTGKVGTVVVKTNNFNIVNANDISVYDLSYLGRGYFDAPKETTFDNSGVLHIKEWDYEPHSYSIQKLTYDERVNLTYALYNDSKDAIIHAAQVPMNYNRLPAAIPDGSYYGDFLEGRVYDFSFYKSEIPLYADLYDNSNNVVSSIRLPNAEGVVIIKISFENQIRLSKINFRVASSSLYNSNYVISSVWIKFDVPRKSIFSSALVPNTLRNPKSFGKTNERPDIENWASQGKTGEDSGRKNTIMGRYAGTHFFDKTIGKQLIWNGTKWCDADGNNADVRRKGTTKQRPDISDVSFGFSYFDTTISKFIFSDGDTWRDANGTEV